MGLLPMDADLLPPSDDRVFKLILTAPDAKPALMDLIAALLNRAVADVAVRNNELPPEDVDEKAERFDVNCTLDDGTQVDLEMQASHIQEYADGNHDNLKGKSVYYLCDLHASQSSRGMRNYADLAQTWQATFCSYTVFPERQAFLNSFSLRHDRDNELFTDAVHILFVELSKLREILGKPVSKMTDLEKWALFFRYANKTECRKTMNEVISTKEELQMAGNLLMSVSQDERERAVFRSRRMYQTDLMSDFATAEDRGRRDGIEIGRRDGIEIRRLDGAHQKSIEFARKMLRRRRPVAEIEEDTGLTREEIDALRREMERLP